VAGRWNPSNLAGVMLLIGAARHYGWDLVPANLAGVASKGMGAAAILALMWIAYYLAGGGRLLLAVLAWWSFEELQVVLCAAAWAVEPWHVPEGAAMCSARAGFDIGALTVIIVAGLALAVSSYRSQETKGHENV
jgi:hypothetical protein